ncbi:MAG: hypothetical protein ABIF19_19650 [Planctomycetota bacterium]
MNRNQRIVLWIGIGAFVLMGLFPMDLRRLLLQWAVVAVITGGLACALRSKKNISRAAHHRENRGHRA